MTAAAMDGRAAQPPSTQKPKDPSLLSLKFFLFFFFGGVGALIPFLPLHMRAAGLTAGEARVVAAVSPLVALLGPLFVGPLAARLAAARRARAAKRRLAAAPASADAAARIPAPPPPPGQGLRRLLIVVLVLTAVYHPLLLAVPTVTRYAARRPAVSFSCSPDGAAVLQERCMQPACHHWPEEKSGRLVLTDCQYDCQGKDENSTRLVGRLPPNHPHFHLNNASGEETEAKRTFEEPREPPHICENSVVTTGSTEEKRDSNRVCHVFTRNNTNSITFKASLRQATNPDADRQEWCHYPLGNSVIRYLQAAAAHLQHAGSYSCHLPRPLGSNCRVLCDIKDPYTAQESLLAQSQCQKLEGNPGITFWTYLIVRCFADCLTTGALVLVDTAVILATRDGAGDVGRQLLAGVLGAAIFAPVAGILSPYPTSGRSPAEWPEYGVPVIIFSGCMIMAAVVLLVRKIRVGAPDWWWQQSRPTWGAPRRAGYETAALFVVLALLGAFCSAIDSYLPWHLSFLLKAVTPEETGLRGVTPDILVGLTVLAGVLPAVPLLWRGEKLIHYCGYSNLLITAFTFYIIRFTGLYCVTSPWWTLVLEATEVFTLSVMWVTAILYFRHLVPRTFVATGQAIAVASHFCIGRSLGALVGGTLAQNKPASRAEDPEDDVEVPEAGPGTAADPDSVVIVQLRSLYATGAIAAGVIAVLYFVIYHCCARAMCGRKSSGKRGESYTRGVVSGTSSNGAYAPVRSNQNGNNAGNRVQRY